MKEEHEIRLEQMITDCSQGTSKVFVHAGAVATARSDFNLKTQAEIAGFISQGGLENPCFLKKREWHNNPAPDKATNPIFTDSWDFYSGKLRGYISFFFQKASNKWNIKSFKKNTHPEPRNLAFANLGKLLENKTRQEGSNT